MKLLPLTIFAYGLCAFFQISEAKKSFNCKSDGMRIRKIQRCDGHFDCKDGSDEEETMCLAYECINDDYVKCKDGLQCVYRGFLCDGDVKSDCRDKSDEDEYFCRANKCKTFHISCNDDLTCVSVTSMCDGHNDCKDKTDENPDFCKGKQYISNTTCGAGFAYPSGAPEITPRFLIGFFTANKMKSED